MFAWWNEPRPQCTAAASHDIKARNRTRAFARAGAP
jgi:hypothetical protein